MAARPEVAYRQQIVSIGEHKLSENSLQSLPDELIWQICLHLDDVTPVSQTCKKILGVTRDESFRANFLWRLHGPHLALFYAIAKRKILSPGLLLTLMLFGAKLPRFLCQELTARFSPPCSIRQCLTGLSSFAIDLPWESQRLLLQACYKRCGTEAILIESGASKFQQAFKREESTNPNQIGCSLPSSIRQMILDHELVPLPLFLCPRDWDSKYVSKPSEDVRGLVMQAIVRWPDVAKTLVSTGFEFSAADKEDIFITVFTKTDRFVSSQVCHCIEALLDIADADFAITESLARDIMYASKGLSANSWRIHETHRGSVALDRQSARSQTHYDFVAPRRSYDVLRLLYASGRLGFDFKTALADTLEMLTNCPDIDPELPTAVAATFTADFPGINFDRGRQWEDLWKKRQDMLTLSVRKNPEPSVEDIRSACEALEITEDLLLATFSNVHIHDDVGLLDYAIKYTKISDWPTFVAKLIRVVLLAPSKVRPLFATDTPSPPQLTPKSEMAFPAGQHFDCTRQLASIS